MNVGSLFSGIGGLDLGLERAGMRVRWQCEIDPYCRAVLKHHWPDVPCYEDIRDIDSAAEPVDLICGGFPCQEVSVRRPYEHMFDETEESAQPPRRSARGQQAMVDAERRCGGGY